MIKFSLKFLIIYSILATSFAFDTSKEIEALNLEYNNYKNYPILIFDKDIISDLLTDSREENISLIQKYMVSKFSIEVTKREADTILDYHTIMNNSASALPFRDRQSSDYRFCAVFPSGAKTDHKQEVKRILGITPDLNPYPKDTVEKVMSLMSLEELKLISLYHELSHCLDKKFVPNEYDTSTHNIHMAESFAESLAIMIVAMKFNFNGLALRRSIVRGYYTRYMGNHIMNDDSLIVMHPGARAMGAVYYLSPVLLSVDQLVSSYQFRRSNFTLDELNNLALENTENYALPSRTLAALVNFLKNGKQNSLEHYEDLYRSSPDLFYITYLNLKKEISFLEDLDFLIDSF